MLRTIKSRARHGSRLSQFNSALLSVIHFGSLDQATLKLLYERAPEWKAKHLHRNRRAADVQLRDFLLYEVSRELNDFEFASVRREDEFKVSQLLLDSSGLRPEGHSDFKKISEKLLFQIALQVLPEEFWEPHSHYLELKGYRRPNDDDHRSRGSRHDDLMTFRLCTASFPTDVDNALVDANAISETDNSSSPAESISARRGRSRSSSESPRSPRHQRVVSTDSIIPAHEIGSITIASHILPQDYVTIQRVFSGNHGNRSGTGIAPRSTRRRGDQSRGRRRHLFFEI